MATPQPWHYQFVTVDRILDGDTLQCTVDLGFGLRMTQHFRLLGVDAPELHGPTAVAGAAARDWLVALLPPGTAVQIDSHKPDKYGRWLAEVWVMGRSVAVMLLEAGHAVPKTYH